MFVLDATLVPNLFAVVVIFDVDCDVPVLGVNFDAVVDVVVVRLEVAFGIPVAVITRVLAVVVFSVFDLDDCAALYDAAAAAAVLGDSFTCWEGAW